jgi:osmoprotectant transport system ATP-binding protein
VIEFESIGKTFRDGTAAVVDLTLTVPSDKITVIVGPSGCGKTTTLRMVNRMLEPTTGRILWDGVPLRSKRKTTLRRQMGYVIQSGGLFPHRTVLDNIGTVPSLLHWQRKKIQKRAFELLDSVGLERKLAQRFPAQLSGGQQQRVGVARALAADPLVMLMDEPFSAVDPVVRSELHEFFLGLQRELSKTIILITHDIDEAIKLGDQVAIMRVGGHLVQVGTPQQLLDEPADAFVEGFVGRDRGFRSLSFQPASVLSLDRVKVVRDVETARGPAPILVVDGDARPVGWADPDRPGRVFPLGATFSPESDSLRGALDSALTSRYGLAVAVTEDTGRYAGVVSAETILDKVKDVRTSIADSISIRVAEAAQEYELLEEPDDAGYEPLGEPEYEYESDDESGEAPEAQDKYEAQYESAQGPLVQYEAPQYESEQYESAQHESAQHESAQHESEQYESEQYESEQYEHESAQHESAQQEWAQDERAEGEPAHGYGTESHPAHDDVAEDERADSYTPSPNGPGSMRRAPTADADGAEVNTSDSQTAAHAPPDVEVPEDRRGSIDAEKPESIIESASDRPTVPIEDHRAALRNHEGWDAIGKAWDRRGSSVVK